MKPTSIWRYIWVGTCLRFLQDQREGWSVHGDGRTVDNIKEFLNALDDLGLHVTKRASHDLIEILEELKGQPQDCKLSAADARRIKEEASDVRKTFEAETKGVYTYVVTDKRIDVQKLLNDVSALFSPGVFEVCSDIARYDFTEAGRCIAFERPTAAAFHILRGTESIVRLYYKRFMRPAQSGLTWGQMTQALGAKTTGKKPDSVLLRNLDHIRTSFRNPTQHPEKVYDIQETQDLFSLCIDAINRMSVSIKK